MAQALAAVALLGQVGGSLLEADATVGSAEAYAKATRYNARAALEEGYGEELRRRRLGQQALGRQRVSYAKAGVRADEGSPLDLLAANAAAIEQDALEARLRGRRAAALQYEAGDYALKSARKQAYASILSGAAKAGGTVYSVWGG